MLEGTLVRLRPQEVGDAERMQRWIGDPEVRASLGNRYPWSLEAELAFLRARAAQRPAFGEHPFAIETRDGRHIGSIGLHNASPENRVADLGIMIGEKDCWSRGYGTDAIRTLLRFAFGELALHRVELQAYADNERGLACYRKCGFVEEVRYRQYRFRHGIWVDAVGMAVLAHEFAARTAARDGGAR